MQSEIADWVKAAPSNAGIDTSKFTACSTRPAFTSKAGLSGDPVHEILKRGNWSRHSSLQNHYHIFFIRNQNSHQSSVGIGSALNRGEGWLEDRIYAQAKGWKNAALYHTQNFMKKNSLIMF